MVAVMPNAEAYKYDDLPEGLRFQIIYAWRGVVSESRAAFMFQRDIDAFYSTVEQQLLEEFGMSCLIGHFHKAEEEVGNFFLQTDAKKCIKVIEIIFECLCQRSNGGVVLNYMDMGVMPRVYDAVGKINARFREHGVGYEFRDGKIIPTEVIKLATRLKAGEPATNLQKIAQVIGKEALLCVHDPYIRVETLVNLQKLEGVGVVISKNLRLLTANKIGNPAKVAVVSFLKDLNTEMSSRWQLRAYTGTAKLHRRFLILEDNSVVIVDLSLNDVDKDGVLDRVPAGSNDASHDCKFFEDSWTASTPV
ncbi:MAG: hypothetical protein PHY43_14160 [Verrucomicrobiales bacterium]|nr:hypothetical protein [Verrucomicrobiales bacterium]